MTTSVDELTGFEFQQRFDDWPPLRPDNPQHHANAKRLHVAIAQGGRGAVRHDMVVPKELCGRLIGPGGSAFKEMTARTGAAIVIFDKDAPPREPADNRLVVLVGTALQAICAAAEISSVLAHHLKVGAAAAKKADGPRVGGGLDFRPAAALTESVAPPTAPPPAQTAEEMIAAAQAQAEAAATPAADAVEASTGRVTCTDPSTGEFIFSRRADNWPVGHEGSARDGASREKAKHIAKQLGIDGCVRHDFMVPAKHCGKCIGPRGTSFRGIMESSGAHIFIFDACAPPTEDRDARIIVLTGQPTQARTRPSRCCCRCGGGSTRALCRCRSGQRTRSTRSCLTTGERSSAVRRRAATRSTSSTPSRCPWAIRKRSSSFRPPR